MFWDERFNLFEKSELPSGPHFIYIIVGLKDMLPIIEKKCIVHLVAVLQGILPFVYSLFTASGLNLAAIEHWMMTGR